MHDDIEPPTIFRLNALMKAGFQLQEAESQHLETSLVLKHPALKRLNHLEVTLYADGSLVGHGAHDQLSIEPGQQREFSSFIRSMPRPTWLEKTLDLRVEIFVWLFFAGLFVVPLIWKIFN